MTKALILGGLVSLMLAGGVSAQAGVSLSCLGAIAGDRLQPGDDGLFTWVRNGTEGVTVFVANSTGLTVLPIPEGLPGGRLERTVRSKLFKGVYTLTITENADGSFATTLKKVRSNSLPWVKSPAMATRLDIVPLHPPFYNATGTNDQAPNLLGEAIADELVALASQAGPSPLFEDESFWATVNRSKELGTPHWFWSRLILLREDAAALERVRTEHDLSVEGYTALKAELERKQADVLKKQSELQARGLWYFEAPTLTPETAAAGERLLKACGDYVKKKNFAFARFKKAAHGMVNDTFMSSREQFVEATKGLDLNQYTASGIER